MSAKLNTLIARLQTKVDALTDTDTRIEADWALEAFAGAANAYEKAAPRGPVTYSIGARSFSFPSKLDAKRAMEDARQDLDSYLSEYGGSVLTDIGGTIW